MEPRIRNGGGFSVSTILKMDILDAVKHCHRSCNTRYLYILGTSLILDRGFA